MKQMKNAQEIAAMTITSQKKIAEERHDMTMNYINLTMAKAIEKAAGAGDTSVKFRVAPEIDRGLIVQVLTAHGFDVSYKGYDVSVDWLKTFLSESIKA